MNPNDWLISIFAVTCFSALFTALGGAGCNCSGEILHKFLIAIIVELVIALVLAVGLLYLNRPRQCS